MDTIRFGLGIRALRRRRGWRQEDLASAAGLTRGPIGAIELGRADRVTVATLEQVAAALGARVVCRLSWNGEELDRLLDAAHAAIVEEVVRFLRENDWLVRTEVSFSVYGERGSIDVLAIHPATRVLLVVEVKSAVADIQGTLIPLDRKARLAPQLARDLGWDPVAVARLLVIREDRTARRRVDEHAETFAAAFPVRGRAVRAWLRLPSARPSFAGLWFLSGESHTSARRPRRVVARPPERGWHSAR